MQTNSVSLSATICACTSRSIIDKTKVAEVASALTNAGYAVKIEADLCKIAITDKAAMAKIANTTIVACHSRAVKSLFANHNLVPKQSFDIRNSDCDTLLNALGIQKPATALAIDLTPLPIDCGQEAWYPVIDKERCTECGKCHDFCLFGVYATIENEIKVTQPQNCKNNCPACARICPQKAVIFPKYEKSPINGGLIDEEQATKIDTKALYANALRLKLEERKAGVSLLKKNDE